MQHPTVSSQLDFLLFASIAAQLRCVAWQGACSLALRQHCSGLPIDPFLAVLLLPPPAGAGLPVACARHRFLRRPRIHKPR